MSLQQTAQPRSSADGFGRRRNDRDSRIQAENRLHAGKMSERSSTVGEEVTVGSQPRERLVYLTTCLIGNNVEVQVLDGSVYSGIFHSTNGEDFGIILKMARLIRDGSGGAKSNLDFVTKPPPKILIIPSNELVQVIAKDVPVTCDGLTPELLVENKQELMTDSCISQSQHVGLQRELERWVPDDDVPVCAELESIFDGSWNRGWDQFEVNKTLFGVKSTFNEELYTTRLYKGPQTRELEKEAQRIAREIEGEDTDDLHQADERGIKLHENLEVDEETRFSSVFRRMDDIGYDDTEDIVLDSCNDETFGGVSSSMVQNIITVLGGEEAADKDQIGGRTFSKANLQERSLMSLLNISQDLSQSGSDDPVGQLSIDPPPMNASMLDGSRVHKHQYTDHVGGNYAKEDIEKKKLVQQRTLSNSGDACSSSMMKEEDSGKVRLSADATSYAPPRVSLKSHDKGRSPSEQPEVEISLKTQGTAHSSNSHQGHCSSASSNSDIGIAALTSEGPRISPSSSVGSFSSEKSTLNPYAKEFRLNPKAKTFSPFQAPMRPASPLPDGSFYYPANMATVPHMHGIGVGAGLGPAYPAHQPVIFNPHATPATQAYFPPGGHQMMFGHPRQLVYMPTYPTEMQYQGRQY